MAPNIGNIGDTGGTTQLPYAPGSIHPPLTVGQRGAIIKYLESQGYTLVNITNYVGNSATSKTSGALDGALISMYDTVAQGGGVNTQNDTNKTSLLSYIWGKYLNPWTASEPGGWLYNENKAVGQSVKNAPGVSQIGSAIHSMDDLANALGNPNLWIRIAEFAVGGILLLVGADAILKQKSSTYRALNQAAPNPVGRKSGVKYAKFS